MNGFTRAVSRPVAALAAALTSNAAYSGLVAIYQPLGIPSAIGLVALAERAARPPGCTASPRGTAGED